MDPFEQTEPLLDRMTSLAEKLIQEHKPGASLPDDNPDLQEISGLLKQVQDLCEFSMKQTIGDGENLIALVQAELEKLEAQTVAAAAAAGAAGAATLAALGKADTPASPPPAPLNALAFADLHEPSPVTYADQVARPLLELPQRVFGPTAPSDKQGKLQSPPQGPRPKDGLVLPRIFAGFASEVCADYTPGRATRTLLPQKPTPLQLLDHLVAAEDRYREAVDFLAHALMGKRVALWWGCLCVWGVTSPQTPPGEQKALASAVRWLLVPTEEHCLAAGEFADSTAAGLLATATANTLSLAPPTLPPIEPPPGLLGDTVAAALHLAATRNGPERLFPSYRTFIALGIRIAQGRYLERKKSPHARDVNEPYWPGQYW